MHQIKKIRYWKEHYPEVIAQPWHQPVFYPSHEPCLKYNQWPSNCHKSENTGQTDLHPFDLIWSELVQIEVPDQPRRKHNNVETRVYQN